MLRRPGLWALLAIGALPFAAWMILVMQEMAGRPLVSGHSGLSEIGRNLSDVDLYRILKALGMPLLILAFAMPVSLALISSCSRQARQQPVVSGLLGAIVVALLIGVVARLVNARYLYIVMPLMAPLAGMVLQSWMIDRRRDPGLGRLLSGFAIVLAVATIVLTVAWSRRAEAASALLIGVCVFGIVVAALTVQQFLLHRDRAALPGLVALLVVFSIPFGWFQSQRRAAASCFNASATLRERVPPGTELLSSKWAWKAPELFFYAERDVRYHSAGLQDVLPSRDTGVWVVLHVKELKILSRKIPGAFERVYELPVPESNAVLAWYAPPLD